MSNTQTLILIFAVFYLVPLSLMFVRRIWIKVYFAVVLTAILLLGYDMHVELQAEDDCGAGCALVISVMVLTAMAVVAGSLLAVLSALAFKKWRTFVANKSMWPTLRTSIPRK